MKQMLNRKADTNLDDMKSEDVLAQCLVGIKNSEMEDVAKFILFYRDIVVSVSKDVLDDEMLAKESARETMETVIKLIQKGINIGKFEPWLMWVTRNIALQNLSIALNKNKGCQTKENVLYAVPSKEETDCKIPNDIPESAADKKRENFTPLVLLKSQREENTMSWDEPEEENNCSNDSVLEDQAAALRKKMKQLQKKTKENFFEEEQTEMPQDEDSVKEYPKKINFKNANKKKKSKTFAVNIGMVALCTFLLWVIIGLAGKNIGLEIPDMGYSWFNSHMFSLF